jgi:nucleoside-triphosphatase
MKNFLITGLPGIGKTMLVMKLAELLGDVRPAGFYTREIREEGIRKGFEIVGLSGGRSILAHADVKSPFMAGKYGVDVETLEGFLHTADLLSEKSGIVIIDEIGRMECYSKLFQELVVKLLDSDRIFVATIALRGDEFISRIKARKDTEIFVVLRENRDALAQTLASRILGAMSS